MFNKHFYRFQPLEAGNLLPLIFRIGLFLLLVLVSSNCFAQQSGTIPTSVNEAVAWLRAGNNSVKFNEDNQVVEVEIEYVPMHFVIGDLQVFEHLETIKIDFVDDFVDSHMSGISRLKNVKNFSIIGCDQVSSAALSVMHYLPALESLTIKECVQIKSLESLATCINLKELHLTQNTDFNFGEFAHLESLPALEFVNLSGCDQLTDGELSRLARLKSLRKFSLSLSPQISDAGLDAILQAGQLEELSIEACDSVRGGFATKLSKCPIKKLNLTGMALTDEAITQIAKLTQLTSLTLIDSGTGHSLLAGCFNDMRDLEKLNLRRVRVSVEALGQISSKKIEELDLTECTTLNTEFLVELPSFATLKLLSCSGVKNVDLDTLSLLTEKFPNLETLDLSGARLKTPTLTALENFRSLKKLRLANCRFLDDQAMLAIAKLKSLETLDISGIWRLTDGCFEHLSTLPNLQGLRVGENKKITGTGLVHFEDSESLDDLMFDYMPGLTPNGMSYLKNISSLDSLAITNCPLSDEHVSELHGLRVGNISLLGSVEEIDWQLLESVMRSMPNTNSQH